MRREEQGSVALTVVRYCVEVEDGSVLAPERESRERWEDEEEGRAGTTGLLLLL